MEGIRSLLMMFRCIAAFALLPLQVIVGQPERVAERVDAAVVSGVLDQVEAAKSKGEFAAAERMLRERMREADPFTATAYGDALEIIRRIRLDFAQTSEELLARVRHAIPDADETDFERWRDAGVLQYRVIDGELRYFVREPGNLFRFCAEARERRDRHPQPPKRPGFDLTQHLARLVELGEQAEGDHIHPVRHRIRYGLKVKPDHPAIRAGAVVRCWLPFPQEYAAQRDVRLISATPGGPQIAPNGAPHRTLFWERTLADTASPIAFDAEFEYTSAAIYPKLDPARVKPYDTSSDMFTEHTAERPPHIVFSAAVRDTAREIVGNEPNPLLKARRIFRWVSENIPWCAEMEYSTIPNLSAKGLEARRGDCGVQGMLFITLCRAAGVPARWQSGWQTKPGEWNMHDWSEIYVEPWGWLPVDASYGSQDHSDPRVQEFYLGHLDPYRLIVNLDYARPLVPPKRSLRSEPNDFQRGEIEIDGKNLYYDEWDWTFEVETTP